MHVEAGDAERRKAQAKCKPGIKVLLVVYLGVAKPNRLGVPPGDVVLLARAKPTGPKCHDKDEGNVPGSHPNLLRPPG